jgi:hypothetical protein
MENLKGDIKAELSKLINDETYKRIRGSLEKLRAIVNARPEGRSGDKALVDDAEVSETLSLLKEMFWQIESGTATPHEAYTTVLSKAAGTVSKGNVYDFDRVRFLSESIKEIKLGLETIYVPVVLLVMSQAEALQLASDNVFQNYHNFKFYFEQFGKLQESLAEEKVTDLLQHYGEQREQWRPFGGPKTIGQLITEALSKVQDFRHPLQPEFLDIQMLTDETVKPPAKRSLLRDLRSAGCLVVMDVVSMHHPEIQKAYRRSLLDVFSHILVIRVGPTARSLKDQVEQELLWFVDKFEEMEFQKRRVWDLDANCDEVYDALDFMHSLVTRAPLMVDERLKRIAAKNIQTDFRNGVAS